MQNALYKYQSRVYILDLNISINIKSTIQMEMTPISVQVQVQVQVQVNNSNVRFGTDRQAGASLIDMVFKGEHYNVLRMM